MLTHLITTFDQCLRTLTGGSPRTGKPYPAKAIAEPEPPLAPAARKHAASLMRVNHAGEVAAQALYHGQAASAKSTELATSLKQAAFDEGDHLHWCETRINQLHGHTSYLGPLWYSGAFCIGLLAGVIGDKWSLGFIVETERQVIKHLEKQINKLPNADKASQAILTQMQQDEAAHRDHAQAQGAKPLPAGIKFVMKFTSKIMVKTAYWV